MGYQESFERCMTAHKEAIARPLESRGLNVRNPAYWLGGLANNTTAGISVTPVSAMRTSAVWACIRVLSYSYAVLPLHTLRNKGGGGKEPAIDYPVYNLLHRKPNPEMTSFTFRMFAMAMVCLYGNFYAEIEFDNFGMPVALWWIPSWCCKPVKTKSRELFYQVTIPDTGENRNLQPYRMLHVMGLGMDGMQGLSPIRQHAETIGITLAAEQYGGSFFSHGMNVGGIVEHPGKITVDGATKLRASLNEKYAGLGNAHRLMLLEEGMKYQKVGINPSEAQLLEERQYQVEDIGRIFGVQLHKIGHLLHATFSNIEHQGIEFVTDTMLPYAVNFEQEYDRKLLPDGLYTKHSLEGLLRGDSASRAAFYRELFYLSAISPDEIREKEDWNPIPDGLGNRYFVQANMIPADKVDEYLSKDKGAEADSPRSLAAGMEAVRGMMNHTMRKIAEREKENILRQVRKSPDKFSAWLTDFYRDFRDYIIRQVEPALGEKAGDYAQRYIELSKRDLADIPADKIEEKLANWETTRPEPSLTGLV